ncbi:MAG: 3-hydroxyacyl-CoA dehydrogenase family protein [Candidatus Hodarchaeota archaeon]
MEIKKIAVLGLGIMGNGIAHVCAQAGYEVWAREINDSLVKNGLQTIRKNLERGLKKGRITEEEIETIMTRIHGTTDLKATVKDADIVIEAIIENMELKKQVFREIAAMTPDHCIFASNTSSLSITELASATKRPDKFLGMHFFNPVPVMKLVEIIKGSETSNETVQVIDNLAKKLGKETVLCNKDTAGFIVNRILIPWLNSALNTVYEGIASPEDVDKAMKLGTNVPMGPLELLDFVGLDTTLHILEYMKQELGPTFQPSPWLKDLVRAGRLGRKTGRGIFDYRK